VDLLDLTVIALGAGAFFTGFLLYILKIDELRSVINSAVVIGLVCYSGAVACWRWMWASRCARGSPSGIPTCTPC
jgi:hypothetical protein